MREQEISVNFGDINFEAAQGLSIPLLDGKAYEAVRSESEGFARLDADEFTWRGKIYQDGWSGDVILTVKGQAMSGLIYSPGGVYEIVPQENFRHLLVEIDQSRFPACAGAIPAKTETESRDENTQSTADVPVAPDDGSQIDVLVVYTAHVRSALGGTTQTQAFIQQAVASSNSAYQNSGINPRLRLVSTLEVNYNEAAGTLDAALNWVDSDATVAAARDSAKADLVAILIENASDGCGLAYVMRSVGAGFSVNAFSATARSCAVGNLSFAHELGHNQGCEHNPENGPPANSASYPYAFGHYVNGSFRTVMSYANPCTSGCTRQPYFSNPSVTLNGFPTGIADQRDNHRVINNTALTISQFRESGGGGGSSPNLTPYQPTGWSDKVVVSNTTGTSTDSTLSTNNTLYVDWAVINSGTAATGARFYTRILVDGVERSAWFVDPPMNANNYVYLQDFSIGTLSAGTHTVTLEADYSGAISESNEADNNYTKTINVVSPTQPNLTPYQPAGWSDKVVVSSTTGTSTDGSPLSTTDTLYVDWAVINNGTAATTATFYSRVLVDGVERGSWYISPPMNANGYLYLQDFSIGSLSAGNHTVTLQTDYTGAISESNEADNNYTKTINVTGNGALQFYPLPHPIRLLDTRPGMAACDTPGAALAGGSSRTEVAVGSCTGIPAGARALVGNATVINSLTPSASGFITLYPNGAARPTAANVNYEGGGPVVVNNAFTAGLSAGGAFNIYAHTGVHLVVDVTGYYAPPAVGSLYYHPLPAPVRLLDTRPGQPACDMPGAALAGGVPRTEVAAISCTGIPAGARALVGNATVINSLTPSTPGFITLYPNGATRPTAANVNYEGSGPVVVNNAFTVGLSTGGAFNIYAHTGVHLVVDVTGYYSDQPNDANGAGLSYYGLSAPVRLLDTRPGQPACDMPGAALAGGVSRMELAITSCTGVPAGSRALVGNATVINSLTPSTPGFITLYPTDTVRPTAANVNYEGSGPVVVNNAFTVGLNTNGVFSIYALTSTHLVIDLSGYYAP
ncbi:MAG TPA: M12 family metallo-peptidase [Pyrinomonadaceae bacterium]